jgi:signal transduction histidine kinase
VANDSGHDREILPGGRADGAAPSPRRRVGLPAKLLVLTSLFVMLAEILIFLPSIANFRLTWLNDRLGAARLAALAAEAVPDGTVPASLRMELLRTAQVRMVALKRRDQRILVLPDDMPTTVHESFDLRPSMRKSILAKFAARSMSIADAMGVFFASKNRVLRIVGEPNMESDESIEVVLPEAPLYQAMVAHSLNILGLSVVISIFTAALVYLALNKLFVRPIMRITDNMLHFSRKPEDASRIIAPSSRMDEIGVTERELAHMQRELSQLLAQKSRLAALGLAVSKINHDLRNMLATAHLLSDRLGAVNDPHVQRFAPKLMASLDRAINFCNDTLKFGRAAEAEPRRDYFKLRALVEDVGDGLNLPRGGDIDWIIDVASDLKVDADRDQFYRVLSNLVRNAVQALESSPTSVDGLKRSVTVRARSDSEIFVIDVTDNGPGIPAKARSQLFQAFQLSTRRGGSGLGLSIAQEIVTAHGGTIMLAYTEMGTTFRIELPDRIST